MDNQEALNPEILNGIQSFSGTPEEMSAGERLIAEGKTLQRTQVSYVTAVKVQESRSLTKVTHNVLEEAKLAGASFYYGWPVTNKDGSISKIEGPSIDLAMCLARNYGNCAIDVEGTETLTHYMLKGIFIDLESGFTCPRLFRQRKCQSMGLKNQDRQEDIVFQIGQSKAIRNAVIRAMPEWLITQAIEIAKSAELGKIKGENLALSREKVLSFFAPYGITQDRIEDKINKKADIWTAENIAELRGMATALKEGRVSADELFPIVKSSEPEQQQESEQQPEQSSGTESQKKDNWWNNNKHWIYNKAESFECLVRLGLGIKETTPAVKQEDFDKLFNENVEAYNTLLQAKSDIIERVKSKYDRAVNDGAFESLKSDAIAGE